MIPIQWQFSFELHLIATKLNNHYQPLSPCINPTQPSRKDSRRVPTNSPILFPTYSVHDQEYWPYISNYNQHTEWYKNSKIRMRCLGPTFWCQSLIIKRDYIHFILKKTFQSVWLSGRILDINKDDCISLLNVIITHHQQHAFRAFGGQMCVDRLINIIRVLSEIRG